MPRGGITKPNRIKILEGNRSKVKTAKLTGEPKAKGKPQPPGYFSDVHLALWTKLCRALPEGLLAATDEGVLERYVVAWERFRDTTVKIARTGLLVQSPHGPIRNPLLITNEKAAKEMHAAGCELGLSPAARSRMTAPTAGEDDPMELLLGAEGHPDGAWSTRH